MTWDEHRRRNAALDAVLSYAAAHPDADLPFDEMPGLHAIFGDRRGLVLALQRRWSQQLWIELSAQADRSSTAAAWSHCATHNRVLRRVLDQHLPALGDAALERYESVSA